MPPSNITKGEDRRLRKKDKQDLRRNSCKVQKMVLTAIFLYDDILEQKKTI